MASILQAARKATFALQRPLVKMVSGGTAPLTEDEKARLPPGQYATDRLSVLHRETEMPTQSQIEQWTLTVDGAVERPVTLTLERLKRLPVVDITADFHCVTGWTRFANRWRGVRVRDVLSLAEPARDAKYVTQVAHSGHTTSTPLADLLADDALLAWEHDGKPLDLRHGAPLRVILPGKYAYKGVKWLTQLTVTRDEELGYWEIHGYSQTADPWKEDRYS